MSLQRGFWLLAAFYSGYKIQWMFAMESDSYQPERGEGCREPLRTGL